MKTRICIFDDSKAILQGFELMVGEKPEMEIAGSYLNTNNLLRHIEQARPDVIIMDIQIPSTNGIDAVKTIRTAYKTLPILMFTVFDDDENIFNAICAGANGYLLKNAAPEMIIQSIEEVQTGGGPMSPAIARRMIEKFQSVTAAPDAKEYDLTTREKEVLKLLTQGLSYKMIAAECSIGFETVRTHVKNIYSKLHVASMTEAVAKALNEKII